MVKLIVTVFSNSNIISPYENAEESFISIRENYINNVIRTAGETYNRGNKTHVSSNTTTNIHYYDFPTRQNAVDYLAAIRDISNEYANTYFNAVKELKENGLINTSITYKII